MNCVFMGTPDFAVPSLEKLISADFNISLVVTQKDKKRNRGKKLLYTPVKEKALDLGLEVYQPDSINSKEALEILRKHKPDCIIVVAYGQILKEQVLNLPKFACINVHASLLPKYRGPAPINWAIINGDKYSGVTIMKMEEGLDTGDILNIKKTIIGDEEDSIVVHDRLSILGGDLLIDTLEDLDYFLKNRIAQNHDISTYAPKLDKSMGRINWEDNGDKIVNFIRGLKPWPGTYTNYKDEILKIHKASKIKKIGTFKPGYIVKATNEGIFVNCGDSTIIIEELQFPNKRSMKVRDYLVGNEIQTEIFMK